MKQVIVGWGLLVALALTGCSASAPLEPTPTVSSEQATPTPTRTATADSADPANWIIGFGSIGPLVVGGTLADAGSALDSFAVTRQDACPSVPSIDREGFPNLLAPEVDGLISQLAVSAFSGIPTTNWPTAAGIAIGSTEADLQAAYPGIVGTAGKYDRTHYSTTDGSGYFINFAVNQGAVEQIVTRDTENIDGEYCG